MWSSADAELREVQRVPTRTGVGRCDQHERFVSEGKRRVGNESGYNLVLTKSIRAVAPCRAMREIFFFADARRSREPPPSSCKGDVGRRSMRWTPAASRGSMHPAALGGTGPANSLWVGKSIEGRRKMRHPELAFNVPHWWAIGRRQIRPVGGRPPRSRKCRAHDPLAHMLADSQGCVHTSAASGLSDVSPSRALRSRLRSHQAATLPHIQLRMRRYRGGAASYRAVSRSGARSPVSRVRDLDDRVRDDGDVVAEHAIVRGGSALGGSL